MHVDLKAQPITEKEKENARLKKKKKKNALILTQQNISFEWYRGTREECMVWQETGNNRNSPQ